MARVSRHDVFEATGYTFNFGKLREATVVEFTDDGKKDITAGAVLERVLPHRFYARGGDGKALQPPPPRVAAECKTFFGETTITRCGEEVKLDATKNGFAVHAIETVIALDNAIGDEPMQPTFFYYDNDTATQNLMDAFAFFVVNGDRIVSDSVTFIRDRDNGFSTEYFVSEYDHGSASWLDESDWYHARVRRWYRRFYEETACGQLMGLRGDNPALYYYIPDWKRHEIELATAQQLAAKTHSLQQMMRVTLVLLAVIAYLLWR